MLDTKRLDSVRRKHDDEATDAEMAGVLVRLAHREFLAYGTNGHQRLNDDEIHLCVRALRAVCRRLGITLEIPFSDFESFRGYWLQNDGHGSWAARRSILAELFEPLIAELDELENDELAATLVTSATSHPGTGWPTVDREVEGLRRHFRAARTEQDYRNVGNDCVAVLERLSQVAYDPARHLRTDETQPPVHNTKQRLERVIDDALPGPGNAEFRKLAKATIEAAQAVKHRGSPDRTAAGIAADAVIQLANILRRLSPREG